MSLVIRTWYGIKETIIYSFQMALPYGLFNTVSKYRVMTGVSVAWCLK